MCAAACFSPFPQSKLTLVSRKPDSRNLGSVGKISCRLFTKYVLCVMMSFSVKQNKQCYAAESLMSLSVISVSIIMLWSRPLVVRQSCRTRLVWVK